MTDMQWKDAIEKVLQEEKKAMNYTEIAELIAERRYRTSLGATPQQTVIALLSTDTKKDDSIFVKVDKGIFALKEDSKSCVKLPDTETEKIKTSKHKIKKTIDNEQIINAFGIYWNRTLVHWKSAIPDLLGIQQIGAKQVNFKEQKGIYLLHDSRETIYIGQAIEQTLGKRLKDHTTDRLAGRWDRFSWFGFFPVNEEGKLSSETEFNNLSIKNIGDILEAILIESIEPRQNRKQGNSFVGLEFLQKEAPEIEKNKMKQMFEKMKESFE